MSKYLYTLCLGMLLSACGSYYEIDMRDRLPPVGRVGADNTVVHGRAIVVISNRVVDPLSSFIKNILFPMAYAASSGSASVTYTNATSTNFSIDVSGLAPNFTPTFTADTLHLGNVTISSLSDNNLKVCNPGGNTKCTQAMIRVYTTGSTVGFIHTTDLYGVPVYAGTLNPTSPVGLNSAGSVQVQTYTIGVVTKRLTLGAFPSPIYDVSSDFSNAGAGSYSMTFVVEYALAP